MARWGRKRNLERERLYWDLLASGLGTVQACRQVGIGIRARRDVRRGALGRVDVQREDE